uniref:BAR domain-containing protein n=2 Tax=Caenorhabditis tropicalis TaxID=1561998 RepID=A0A1I7UDV8_9PELO
MMMASRSMRSSREPKGGTEKGFYGLADHQNRQKFSSILKRKKSANIQMADEVKSLCKQVEAYKSCSDNLHQSLMFMIVENEQSSKKLHVEVKTEPNLRYAAQYLKTYESVASTGKTKYESLEPAIKVLTNLDAENEKRVKKLLEALKPLTKWIGEDYWEYVRLRAAYCESLASAEEATAQQSKEKSEPADRAAANAQKKKTESLRKLVEFIKNEIFEQKQKHADSVLKFRDEMIAYHKAMAELIPFADQKPNNEQKSVRKSKK